MTRDLAIWAAVAAADRFSVSERETLARRLTDPGAPAADEATLVTCHRVEVYGIGSADETGRPGDRPSAAALLGSTPAPAPVVVHGEDALRHLFRLAVGLESAVLGEDQVLHQLRLVLGGLRDRHADPRLIRMFDLAVGAGRRVRAGHPAHDRNLGELAVLWLERDGPTLRGSDVVIAGSGPMGRLAAGAVARRGAHVLVASQSLDRAATVAERVGGVATDLAGGAAAAGSAAAVVVALAGPWPEFEPQRPQAVVDLSFPSAVSRAARETLGDAFADVDRLFRDAEILQTGGHVCDFRAHAEAIVNEAIAAFQAWNAGRPSVSTLRALRDRSEEHRRAELQRLLRRIPKLEPRERALVEAFSQRLVAGLLHEPSAALRDDIDGTAANAAQRLFGL